MIIVRKAGRIMMTMILIVVLVVTVGGEEMVMVKTMVKRRGPHKLNWKSFFSRL